MNAKVAKFLRKKSRILGLHYKNVKNAFKQLTKEEQAEFIRKWSSIGGI